MNRTKIEYLTHTWNPIIMRCTPVSEGCVNCWHLRYCNRMKDNKAFTPDRRDRYSGTNTADNILPICKECNQKRSHRWHGEVIAMKEAEMLKGIKDLLHGSGGRQEQIVRRDGYQFCEKHQQEYRQYCSGCAVGMTAANAALRGGVPAVPSNGVVGGAL